MLVVKWNSITYTKFGEKAEAPFKNLFYTSTDFEGKIMHLFELTAQVAVYSCRSNLMQGIVILFAVLH